MGSKLTIPISILVAGAVIAGALVATKLSQESVPSDVTPESLATVPLLTSEDHFLGNPKASIVIVEYSDYDCPFCASYFTNMKKVVEELGKGGRIVWVHRHMPFPQLHETAQEKAIAAECAAEIGGEDKFWQMSEALYKNTLSKGGKTALDISVEAGLPKTEMEECIESERHLPKILAQYEESYTAGGRGVPFTVIIKGKERFKMEESLSYFDMRNIVESFLDE